MDQSLKINYARVALLGSVVRSFCYSHDAWIVGSGAKYLLNLPNAAKPRDWDILIPFWSWGIACKTIPEGTPTNAHGGVKLIVEGTEIDVWAGDIGWFLAQVPNQPAYAVNPRTMTFLISGKEVFREKHQPSES